tara:strand:+ start:1210 stop:2610 length:1401 start_codon:yes stop_codon:yes gene_type:complete
MITKEFTDDLDKLIELLPIDVKESLSNPTLRVDLLEVVLDLGRLPEARYPDRVVILGKNPLVREALNGTVDQLGGFGTDNRAGIEGTLHRISAIRNRNQEIIGLTCRVGRAVFGTVEMVRDLIETGRSILLMGRPGVGKTTVLREIARVMADELRLRVIIIDTSNEIGGDGDIPHPGIGRARRMQVSHPADQHQVMVEAVENHMPQVVVIDEIGTKLEAEAARTIAERGVQLIATAHGNKVSNLIKNPTLSDLIGGIQSVTLGDEEAKRRKTQKAVLERSSEPTFSIAVEINSRTRWFIHKNVASTVDAILRGKLIQPEKRELMLDRFIRLTPLHQKRSFQRKESLPDSGDIKLQSPPINNYLNEEIDSCEEIVEYNASREFKIFCCGISTKLVNEVLDLYPFKASLVHKLIDADVVLSLRNQMGRNNALRQEAKKKRIPIYILKSDSYRHIERSLIRLIKIAKKE